MHVKCISNASKHNYVFSFIMFRYIIMDLILWIYHLFTSHAQTNNTAYSVHFSRLSFFINGEVW